MKKKISISISTRTFEIVRSNVDGNTFRNSSHFIEYAINKFIEENEEENFRVRKEKQRIIFRR